MSAMPSKPTKRPLRSLTAHEKLLAIRRVHDGESKAAVARDIGVPESTLRGWCKNEEKISYISRQSSPDTDDSVRYEPKEKRQKRSEDSNGVPFNLSLKPNQRVSYSPNSEAGRQEERPLNLNTKPPSTEREPPKTTERERNRAELARLSIELGLNRPEMYPPATASTIDINNMHLLAQWNNLILQQKALASQPDTSASTSSQAMHASYNQQEREAAVPPVDPTAKSVEESVWYWLRAHQAMLALNQNQSQSQNPNQTAAASAAAFPQIPSLHNIPIDLQQSSWFWRWYKQITQLKSLLPQNQMLNPQQIADRILYQQLTKDNTENLATTEERPRSSGSSNNRTARAVLDNLLLNNNNVTVTKQDSKEDAVRQTEALEHGEKFLRWLECCGEPSVTAMQIMQFRGLINNIKSGTERKNGNQQKKSKVRRK